MPTAQEAEAEHDTEEVRTRRPSEPKTPTSMKTLAPVKRSFTLDYLFEYLCALMWVCMFMSFPLCGWMTWIGLITWLLLEAAQLYPLLISPTEIIVTYNLLRFVAVLLFVVCYQWHWLLDRGAEERGSHPRSWIRNLFTWHYLRQYFPINLILSKEIQLEPTSPDKSPSSVKIVSNPALFPTDQNYIVGYHPHGIFGVGAFVNFATDTTGFSSKFPGITPWLTTLELNFKSPFHRDFLLSFNIVAATYKGISYLLNPDLCGKKGNMVVVVLGGAPEALDSRPGKYVFHTNRRYGFFKLALMTGSALVPCVSFGEPNMYHQVKNPQGCKLRSWQDRFTEWATFSPPIFYAHILSPYRTPVNTVVGAPIPVAKVENPSREQVAALKELYLKNLNDLFQRHKPIYDPGADDLEFF